MQEEAVMDKYCYVGKNPKCGHIRAVVVDDGDKSTAADVADFIRRGAIVERIPSAEFRKNGFGRCEICAPEKK